MKSPRATKDDLDEIKSGYWDSWGDVGALIQRLRFSLIDARAEASDLKRESLYHYRHVGERSNK